MKKVTWLKSFLILLLALGMTGCDWVIPEQAVTDQCLRRELFKECMELLPAGPDSTVYSDWDEVVEECGIRAYYQSQRMKAF